MPRYNEGSQRRLGLCVIFTLFTGDLRGYVRDRSRAFEFFRDTLKYDVFSGDDFTNCNKEQLLDAITLVRNEIDACAENGKPYDRLVVIILTHGKEEGLLTCDVTDPENVLNEYALDPVTGKYKAVFTTVEEIVECFKHDKVPSLKGVQNHNTVPSRALVFRGFMCCCCCRKTKALPHSSLSRG